MRNLRSYDIIFWAIFIGMALGGFAMVMIVFGFLR
jgi:hypothetical protein